MGEVVGATGAGVVGVGVGRSVVGRNDGEGVGVFVRSNVGWNMGVPVLAGEAGAGGALALSILAAGNWSSAAPSPVLLSSSSTVDHSNNQSFSTRN